MKNIVKKYIFRSVLISLALAAMGVIIIINANEVLFWVIKVIGALLLIDAVIRFIQFLRIDADERSFNFDIVRAVVEAVLGLIAIINSSSVVTLLYIFIGVIVVVEGILHIQFVLTRKGELNHWILNFFIAIINILCGVFIIAHPIMTSSIINVIIGIEILIASILGIISYIYLYVTLKNSVVEVVGIEN